MLAKAIALLIVATSLTAVCRAANAQDSTTAAAARLLYDEGRALLKEGKYDVACPKLERSQELSPATDTKFWLADCYEHTGRPASAWQLFRESADESKAQGNEKKTTYARERAQAMLPRLSRLKISVPEGAMVDGLDIKRDGNSVGKALWEQDIPVDPGDYLIRAEAPGKRPWEEKRKVDEGSVVVIIIPRLEDAPGEPVETKHSQPPPSPTGPVTAVEPDRRDWRLLGPSIGAGVVGLAGLVVGTAYGLAATSQWNEAKEKCSIPADCYPGSPASQLSRQAADSATGSNIGFVIGAGALAASGVLLYLGLRPSPAARSSALLLVPHVGSDGARLSVLAIF